MADAYNAEARARCEAEEAWQDAEAEAITSESVIIQVARPRWFRKVYVSTGSGELLPVYVSVPSREGIKIPVDVRPSGHYQKIESVLV